MSQLGNYRIIRALGGGTFGKVKCKLYLVAQHEITKTYVAIKVLSKKNIREKQFAQKVTREINLLKFFQHPHIIRLYEVISTHNHLLLVMEYLPGGELYSLIERNGRLCEELGRYYLQQIVSGIEYCHFHRVVHRDIKPENLLLDQNGNVKIADFGLSNFLKDGEFLKTSCGSPNYAAPEVISGNKYCGPEVDVWSLGVVLYALLAGFLPFDEGSIPVLFSKIKAAKFQMPYHFSEPVKDLIFRMLNPDPLARITIKQIMKHPWFKINIPPHIKFSEAAMFTGEVNSLNRLRKGDSARQVDEEVLYQVLSLPEFKKVQVSLESLKESITNKENTDLCVCYEIMLDEKLGRYRDQLDKKLCSIVPLFKQISLESMLIEDSTEASSRKDSEENLELNSVHSVVPNNWVYGFRCILKPYLFMVKLFESLRGAGLEWKILNNFCLLVRSQWVPMLKFQVNIYKYLEIFVLDFKLKKGNTMVFFSTLHRVYDSLHKVTHC